MLMSRTGSKVFNHPFMKPCDQSFQDLHDINDWAGDKPKTIPAFKLKVIGENFITKKSICKDTFKIICQIIQLLIQTFYSVRISESH